MFSVDYHLSCYNLVIISSIIGKIEIRTECYQFGFFLMGFLMVLLEVLVLASRSLCPCLQSCRIAKEVISIIAHNNHVTESHTVFKM